MKERESEAHQRMGNNNNVAGSQPGNNLLLFLPIEPFAIVCRWKKNPRNSVGN
jgi:hypothetical protein